jgi:hypothetical protein
VDAAARPSRHQGGSAGSGHLRFTVGRQDGAWWAFHAARIDDGTIIGGRGRAGLTGFLAHDLLLQIMS